MKKLMLFVFLAAMIALPSGAQAQNGLIGKPLPKEKPKDRTVPEPATMLLVGAAAAGFIGVRKLLRKKRD